MAQTNNPYQGARSAQRALISVFVHICYWQTPVTLHNYEVWEALSGKVMLFFFWEKKMQAFRQFALSFTPVSYFPHWQVLCEPYSLTWWVTLWSTWEWSGYVISFHLPQWCHVQIEPNIAKVMNTIDWIWNYARYQINISKHVSIDTNIWLFKGNAHKGFILTWFCTPTLLFPLPYLETASYLWTKWSLPLFSCLVSKQSVMFYSLTFEWLGLIVHQLLLACASIDPTFLILSLSLLLLVAICFWLPTV